MRLGENRFCASAKKVINRHSHKEIQEVVEINFYYLRHRDDV